MRISQVAAATGVPASTLRYYDRLGLLPAPRTSNGYREYDQSALQHLAIVNAAKQIGLALPDITELLRLTETSSCTRARQALQPRLDERLNEVDRHLDALRALRTRIATARDQVATCPDSPRPCGIECAFSPEVPTDATEPLSKAR